MALPSGEAHGLEPAPVAIDAVDPRLSELRRARTLARLRRAGLSEGALATLLPEWGEQVGDLAARSALPGELTVAD